MVERHWKKNVSGVEVQINFSELNTQKKKRILPV